MLVGEEDGSWGRRTKSRPREGERAESVAGTGLCSVEDMVVNIALWLMEKEEKLGWTRMDGAAG